MIIKILRGIKKFFHNKIAKTYYRWRVTNDAGQVAGKIKVNHRTRVTRNTYLGNNVNFNGMKISGSGKVEIGDNFHSGADCLIITNIHNFDTGLKIPYDESEVIKNVKIENNVWVGTRVIILGGVTIGEGAVIQAGSVVVKDIPSCAIAGGHPAEVFKYRDIEHYKKLKTEGKFF